MTTRQDALAVMADDTATASPGLVEDVVALAHELRNLVHDYLQLASLEARLSINSVLTMAVIAIVMAVLLVSAWLALLGAMPLGLVQYGLAPVVGMVLLAAVNLLLAVVCWALIRRKSRKLGWPATLRAIRPRALPDRGAKIA